MARDRLGRRARPMRYPVRKTIRLSEDAAATLDEMGDHQSRKVGKVMRRAVMKDIYIYKAEQKRKAADAKNN